MSDSEYLHALGWRIRYLRLKAGMLLCDFAVLCNWSNSRLSNCEAGLNCTIKSLRTISAAFHMHIWELTRVEDKWHWMVAEVKRMDKALRKERRERKKKKVWKKNRK